MSKKIEFIPNRIDIQLSWFRKKDRIEIQNIIEEKIEPLKKNGKLNGFKIEKIAIPSKDNKPS